MGPLSCLSCAVSRLRPMAGSRSWAGHRDHPLGKAAFSMTRFSPSTKGCTELPCKAPTLSAPHKASLCFVLCIKVGSCRSGYGDGNIYWEKNPTLAVNSQAVNYFTVCEGSRTNIIALLHLPLSQMGRGLGEGEKSLHLIGVNILQFLIKYENPAGAGSRTILEYELSRILLPRCSLFPPQPQGISDK